MSRATASTIGRASRDAAGLLRRFARARGGVAAIEFAIVLPVMAVLYLGMAELTRAVGNSRKITMLARTLADLTARGGLSSSDTDLKTIFTAASSVLAPYNETGATMVISSFGVAKSGDAKSGDIFKAKVCWSKGWKNGKALKAGEAPVLTPNAVVAAPIGYETDKIRFIRVDVSQSYVPMLGSGILRWITNPPASAGTPGDVTIPIGDSTVWPVRSNEKKNSSDPYPEVLLPNGSGGATGCS